MASWWLWAMLLLVLAASIFSHRYRWWRRSVPDHCPRILMYHMVSPHRKGAAFNKLRVVPQRFEQQIRWLATQGYRFVSMSELLAMNATENTKTVAITFDDGYEDNVLNADPILAKYGACATLYVVEHRFDRDWSVNKKSHHNSGELMKEAKLSDEQLSTMLASGRWQLGGHTGTHANLSRLNREQKYHEIADSKQALEQRFATHLSSFAYPFGIYDEEDVALAEKAGFVSAVTTIEGIDPEPTACPYTLKRIKVSGKDNRFAFWLRMRTGRRG